MRRVPTGSFNLYLLSPTSLVSGAYPSDLPEGHTPEGMEGCWPLGQLWRTHTPFSPGAWTNSSDNRSQIGDSRLGIQIEKWIKPLEAVLLQTGLWRRGFALDVNSAFCRSHPLCRGSDPHSHPKEA